MVGRREPVYRHTLVFVGVEAGKEALSRPFLLTSCHFLTVDSQVLAF